ncbi:IS110 family RNA-guided transposase [Actinoplanes awajinensis]|uniref:Transposase n=1 Tax=Actinoplanes awajinensis subsp. mycoplanecinus TaxID=135947 RepID=A0A0X3UUH5_9ACTN|nr:IS110 family transposase [Actinoplanes awajinensis]KUL36251.1 transposase [Actinoplanes awajinensis subsp. mycoplanecinus]
MNRQRPGWIQQPQEIPDEDHEQLLTRVCAIDVGKQSGKVCTRIPHPQRPHRRLCQVWDVAATTGEVSELAEHLVRLQVEKVTLESTSDYWRIWFYLLEARGLDVQLVNARDVKNSPGRPKTDKLDAIWLAKLTEKGLMRPSFVPPQPIRELRDYTRTRADLTRDRGRYWQRLEKLLEDALIKVSAVVSSLDTLSARAMIEALIAGERDPRVLAGLARGRMRSKNAALVEALTGQFDTHHGELARMLLDQIDAFTRQIDQLTTRIDGLIPAHTIVGSDEPDPGNNTGSDAPGPLSPVQRLIEIPGIGLTGAQTILAEIGLDMTRFPTAAHLVSWAKLAPRTIQSGTRQAAGRTGKGNPYLKAVLGTAAAAAARTDTFLGARYRRLVTRRGKLKALVAVARSTLVAIWHLLTNPDSRFHDLGADHHTHHINTERQTRNHVQHLQALGYTVTLTTA